MRKKSLERQLWRNKVHDELFHRIDKAMSMESVTALDYNFVISELIDVLEFVPIELQDAAGKKLDRTIMFLKLVREELARGPQRTVSAYESIEVD
jgi:hypothetical protein